MVVGQVLLLTAAVYEGALEVARHAARGEVRIYFAFLLPVVNSGPVVKTIIVWQVSSLHVQVPSVTML